MERATGTRAEAGRGMRRKGGSGPAREADLCWRGPEWRPMLAAMRLPCLLASLALLAACGGPPGNDASPPAANSPAGANAAASTPAPDLAPDAAATAAFLPSPGRHAARAMALAPPAEAIAMRDRMAAAILRNPSWYESYAAQHPRGELPWHINLGISEAVPMDRGAVSNRVMVGIRWPF